MAGGRTDGLIPAGSRFGRWVVLERDWSRDNAHSYYLCRCDCGSKRSVGSAQLRFGRSTQCQSCANRASATTHGESRGKSVEYYLWQRMIQRCQRQGGYADRGIAVCEEWQGDGGFEVFLDHVGRRPTSKHSLDRIDNDRGYEPGNVRWATRVQQARNTRANRLIEVDGRARCVAEWAEIVGISEFTIHGRLRRGWSAREAVYGRNAA